MKTKQVRRRCHGLVRKSVERSGRDVMAAVLNGAASGSVFAVGVCKTGCMPGLRANGRVGPKEGMIARVTRRGRLPRPLRPFFFRIPRAPFPKEALGGARHRRTLGCCADGPRRRCFTEDSLSERSQMAAAYSPGRLTKKRPLLVRSGGTSRRLRLRDAERECMHSSDRLHRERLTLKIAHSRTTLPQFNDNCPARIRTMSHYCLTSGSIHINSGRLFFYCILEPAINRMKMKSYRPCLWCLTLSSAPRLRAADTPSPGCRTAAVSSGWP